MGPKCILCPGHQSACAQLENRPPCWRHPFLKAKNDPCGPMHSKSSLPFSENTRHQTGQPGLRPAGDMRPLGISPPSCATQRNPHVLHPEVSKNQLRPAFDSATHSAVCPGCRWWHVCSSHTIDCQPGLPLVCGKPHVGTPAHLPADIGRRRTTPLPVVARRLSHAVGKMSGTSEQVGIRPSQCLHHPADR